LSQPRFGRSFSLLRCTREKTMRKPDHARIRKAGREAGPSARGCLALDSLRGTANVRVNTDQIMALTRGEARPRRRSN
jgi:hypothetical protein